MNNPPVIVREEEPGDALAIAEVHRAAFETCAEANLVVELRDEGLVVASHVAIEGDRIVGHALYSRMYVDTDDGPVAAVALGPIAVVPDRQRAGLGGAAIRAGLEVTRARGEQLILVLGLMGLWA